MAGLTAAVLLATFFATRSTPGRVLDEVEPRAAVPPSEETVRITVEPGESAQEVGERLEEAGVIESARLFRILVRLLGYDGQLQSGEYEFPLGYTATRAVHDIRFGRVAPIVVTFPEGLRREEMAQLVERAGLASAADFLAATEEFDDDLAFVRSLEGVAPNLEGFLFPDTYFFQPDQTPHQIVEQMLANFEAKVGPLFPQVEGSGLTLLQVVTLASIVEREAALPEERPLIAGVFLNRLAQGMPLEADPTAQFVLGSDPALVAQFGYWKQGLTPEDIQDADSPYNTYLYPGLPPGPIAGPGLPSITAVLRPAETEALFFVACGGEGGHRFALTLEEHLRNQAECLPQ